MKEKNKVISLFDNHLKGSTESEKYASLLKDFMEPFVREFPDEYETEDIITFSMYAWNFANIGKEMPSEKFQQMASPPQMPKKEKAILKRMLALKARNYEAHTEYILDYDLKEDTKGVLKLSVTIGDLQTFLGNMEGGNLYEFSEDDFEENYVNRFAIVLKPRQPFFDWINTLYPDDIISEVEEANVYLVDDGVEDLEKWLRKKFDTFFVMELSEWHHIKKEWPQRRNYKMFTQWFQVDISSMVYDLEKRPVSKQLS